MTYRPADSTLHLGEDELLRFLDGDADDALPAWEAHIATCTQCAAELESMRRDAHLLSTWLHQAAFDEASASEPAPALIGGGDVVDLEDVRAQRAMPAQQPRTRRVGIPPWMRIAAAIALLATPVAAIPSLREWVVGAVTGPPAAPTATTLSVPEARTAGSAVRFVPAPGAFVVEIAAVQAGGELRVSRSASAEAVLAADAADALPVVSPALLRIRNDAAQTGGYSLELPSAVSSITIRIGGRSVTLERSQIDAGASVPLH